MLTLYKQKEVLLAAYIAALDTLYDELRQRRTIQGVRFTAELQAAVKTRVEDSNKECEMARESYLLHLRDMAAVEAGSISSPV